MEDSAVNQQHVRPKVRSSRSAYPTDATQAAKEGDLDSLLENTRQRIQSRLTISSNNNLNETSVVPQQQQTQTGAQPGTKRGNAPKPRGILKQPKYSPKINDSEHDIIMMAETTVTADPGYVAPERPRAAIKDLVMEREPIAQQLPSQSHEPLAVEGYTPKVEESNDPMVISSISDLMDKAGTLPRETSAEEDSKPQVIEANLSFSCMSPDDYNEALKREGVAGMNDPEAKENVFVGQQDPFSDEDTDEEEDDDDSMFGGESDMSEDDAPAPEPRAFMKLWEAISIWATPDSVALLKQWRDADAESMIDANSIPPQVDQSDVGSSRRKGLKSMLNMYLSSAMDDLGLFQEERRKVEVRLDNLLRTFKYSTAMVKYDSKLWKALTCVLVEMVMLDSTDRDEARGSLPSAVEEVGMVGDEYRYLTRSAVISLES